MLRKLLLASTVSILGMSQAFGWGQTGHRITGEIAERYLSEEAQAAIHGIYPQYTLAELSTMADEMRSDPSEFWQRTAGPWHYVTVPAEHTYADVGAPDQGDGYSALQQFAKVLKDPQASIEEQQIALHFSVHIIGDLHQPLHAGNGTDRGGNDRKLEFFWDDSNLHRVWDSGMLQQKELSYTEWTDWLMAKITKEDVKSWQNTDPLVWIAESVQIRDTIYPAENEISYVYLHNHLPIAKTRLKQAGVRIAAYLNELFSSKAD